MNSLCAAAADLRSTERVAVHNAALRTVDCTPAGSWSGGAKAAREAAVNHFKDG